MSLKLIAAAALALAAPARAETPADRGAAFAAQHCAACHAVGPGAASPNRRSPPFPVLAERYVAWSLQAKLTEMDETGHYDMPPVRLHSDEIADLAAYFERLRAPAP